MIEASPEAALVIGHELPAFRRQAAQRIIRNSTLVSLAAGMEPIPLVDIPILLGTQDYAHGWRACFLEDPDGYTFAVGLPTPASP